MTDVTIAGRPTTRSGLPADDALVARAKTEWVFASPQGQPRRIPGEVVKVFRAGTTEGIDGNARRA